jgi:hypothetical protein
MTACMRPPKKSRIADRGMMMGFFMGGIGVVGCGFFRRLWGLVPKAKLAGPPSSFNVKLGTKKCKIAAISLPSRSHLLQTGG